MGEASIAKMHAFTLERREDPNRAGYEVVASFTATTVAFATLVMVFQYDAEIYGSGSRCRPVHAETPKSFERTVGFIPEPWASDPWSVRLSRFGAPVSE